MAALLDTETDVPVVTSGAIRDDLRGIAVLTAPNNAADFRVTAGWGHRGQGGVTMPGRGKTEPHSASPSPSHSLAPSPAGAGGLGSSGSPSPAGRGGWGVRASGTVGPASDLTVGPASVPAIRRDAGPTVDSGTSPGSVSPFPASAASELGKGAGGLGLAETESGTEARPTVASLDVYINPTTCWANVPRRVWDYTIGGYQVMKKWLSYRELGILGRPITPDEAQEVTNMARRIAALVAMEDELDASYRAIISLDAPAAAP